MTMPNQGIRLLIKIVTLFLVINTIADAQEVLPIFGDATLKRNFNPDPFRLRGFSGGSIPGQKLAGMLETPTGLCTGFVDETPDHTLVLKNKFYYLKILVMDSEEGTTLIVKGPGGTWCNDDFDGENAGIVGEWLPGTYQIWVGSEKQGKSLPYTLEITEFR